MLPEVIDLFSGCGGMAIGFEKAGFRVTHGFDIMEDAAKNASYNLDFRYGKETMHICADITRLNPDDYKNKIGSNGCIVIGGPPCQAYSLAGRAKLKSLGEDRINTNDARGYLYKDFLRFVFGLDARAVVMENVLESVNYGGENIPQIVCDELEKGGYKAIWTVLNAADYGVPQTRERVFVLATKENKELQLPLPTHRSNDEKSYTNEGRISNFVMYKNFQMPITGCCDLPPWVTVEDAFSDLPLLREYYDSKYKLVPLNIEMKYKAEPQNEFQKIMRNWYGNKLSSVSANAYRNNSKYFYIFHLMKQGDNYLNACEIADKVFSKSVSINSICSEKDSLLFEKLKNDLIPIYDRSKFYNKWKKLRLDRPSHTVVAHLQKDTFSHIHPLEPRGISVREAARLQSIPDDYYFNCSMSDAFKQIGNAVPPLLAKGIAEAIKNCF